MVNARNNFLSQSDLRGEMVTEKPPEIRKVAFLGDYLTRKCGIATFTADLRCVLETERHTTNPAADATAERSRARDVAAGRIELRSVLHGL